MNKMQGEGQSMRNFGALPARSHTTPVPSAARIYPMRMSTKKKRRQKNEI
jgi:hypothetical protein